MRIAILEDRLERLNKFLGIGLEAHPEIDVISGRDFDRIVDELQNDDAASLTGYDCIAAHRSALKVNAIAALKKNSRLTRKPLIFFSGGITASVLKEEDFPFLLINSKDFYSSHLTAFIDDGKQNGHLNLNVLQFGDRWMLSLLLNLRNHLVVGYNNQSIKRVKDGKIPEQVRQLLAGRAGGLLPDNELAVLSADDVNTLIRIISQLIIEIA